MGYRGHAMAEERPVPPHAPAVPVMPVPYPAKMEEVFRRTLYLFHQDWDELRRSRQKTLEEHVAKYGDADPSEVPLRPELSLLPQYLGNAVETALAVKQWQFATRTVPFCTLERSERAVSPCSWRRLPEDFVTLRAADGRRNVSYTIEGGEIAFRKEPRSITYVSRDLDWEGFPYPDAFLSLIADCLAKEVESMLDPESKFKTAIDESMSIHVGTLNKMSYTDRRREVPPQGWYVLGMRGIDAQRVMEDDYTPDDYGYTE